MNRRGFVNRALVAGTLASLGGFPFKAFAKKDFINLTILHTNDVHSRIESFPSDSKFAGMGGTAARAVIIEKIRREEEYVLLLDSGDIFQGTPYFNYFGGRLEFELMSRMGYDASTLGNHDFDAGLDGFFRQLPYAKFPFLSANYDFSDTILHDRISKFRVFEKGGLKIGVFGIGIELDGLVPAKLFGKTRYLEPVKIANDTAAFLKKNLNCDLVICLSHLGYKYKTKKISDIALASESENIDLILGGHTHTFFERPEMVKNKKGQIVVINQVGWAGIILGRIDLLFDEKFSHKKIFFDTVKVI